MSDIRRVHLTSDRAPITGEYWYRQDVEAAIATLRAERDRLEEELYDLQLQYRNAR